MIYDAPVTDTSRRLARTTWTLRIALSLLVVAVTLVAYFFLKSNPQFDAPIPGSGTARPSASASR